MTPMDKAQPNANTYVPNPPAWPAGAATAHAMSAATDTLAALQAVAEERVLCFPRELLSELGEFSGGFLASGLLASAQESLARVFDSGLMEFVGRAEAESSEEWVQLIPYCLISRGRELFLYRRRGSEGRLSGLFSLGVGGHVNPVDVGPDAGDASAPDSATYYRALRRELLEEIGFECGGLTPHPLGLIYDPSNAVGRVHLGVVHVVAVPNNFRVRSDDPALAEGDFWPVSEVLFKVNGERALYETWTQLVVKHVLT